MNIIQKLFSKKSADNEQEKSVQTVSAAGRSLLDRITEPFTGAWQQNKELTREDSLRFYAISACISIISQDISKLDLNLMRYDSNRILQKTSDENISRILKKPNHYQNIKQFIEFWLISKLKTGNAYILKTRDIRGNVTALHVINSDLVSVKIDTETQDIFYEITADSQNLSGSTESITVPARDIIHDRMNNFYHPLVGLSPLYSCALSTQMGQKIQKNSVAFFGNMSRPSGIITAPGEIEREEAEYIRKSWNAAHCGENMGGISVLGNGLTYTTHSSISAADAQLVEQLKMSEQQICSVFHVPHFFINSDVETSYNNVQSRYLQYFQQCLQTHIKDIESSLESGLDISSDFEIKFDLDGLLKLDTQAHVDFLTKSVSSGIMTPNEARARLMLSKIDGGDSVYLQQQYYSLEALSKRDAQNNPFDTSNSENNSEGDS